MKLISVNDPNVWRSVEESSIRFWGCFGFKPEIMRGGKGQDQSWKGRLQSEKWKANISKTTSDLRDGLTISSDPYAHGRRSNFFPPKNWMRSYGIQYQLPPKSALEGSIRPPICVDFGAAVQLPRSFLWRWAFCDPWPSRCQHLRRCLATPLPQKRTTTAGRKRGWIRTSIRRRGRASTISGGKPGVYSGWPENMVVFLQKCRNEFKGVNDVETQSSILLDIVVTMPIHAIFFFLWHLVYVFWEVTILFQSNICDDLNWLSEDSKATE